jgi:hypothetical protein
LGYHCPIAGQLHDAIARFLSPPEQHLNKLTQRSSIVRHGI